MFAAAAFRFGHTLVANQLESYDKVGARAGAVPITHTQFLPYAMYDNKTVEDYVRGLTTQPAQAFDSAFASELTGHLFQEQCGQSQSEWICKILKDLYPYPTPFKGSDLNLKGFESIVEVVKLHLSCLKAVLQTITGRLNLLTSK